MAAGPDRDKARTRLIRYCEKQCKRFAKEHWDSWRSHRWEVVTEPGAWCPEARIELRTATTLTMLRARIIRASNGETAIICEPEYAAPNPYAEEEHRATC